MIKLLVWLIISFQIVPGTCVSPEQDGREDAGYYISYKGTEAKEGDRMLTLIWNDLNRECERRMDFVWKGEK